MVRALYQNARFGWFATRERLWETVRSRRELGGPTQALRTWPVPYHVRSPDELIALLKRLELPFDEGSHVVYVPPVGGALDRLVPGMAVGHPPGSGLKILKDLRPPAEASYLTGPAGGAVRRALTGSSFDSAAAANFLWARGLGPRVWDVCELVSGPDAGPATSLTAFVVDHVEGATPSPEGCQQFIQRLGACLDEGPLDYLVPRWWEKDDFRCPGCGGNLVERGTGELVYVDFQNFTVDRGAWVEALTTSTGDRTHFGGSRPFRGERYLYQRVPGVGQAAKRNSLRRWDAIRAGLETAGVGFQRRLSLDVGCNAGVMSHLALGAGADWAVGWDRPPVAQFAAELMVALGSTRTSMIGVELTHDADLLALTPQFLRPHLPEAVVLYLAVRETLGVMPSLSSLPWRALAYEGHQGESNAEARRHLEPLLGVRGTEITSVSRYSDGDSGTRPLAVLVRP
jgi:hypothetical protein